MALETWAGGPGMGLGLIAPKISLLNLYPPHTGVGPVHSIYLLPCSFYQLDGCGLFNYVAVRLPFNSVFIVPSDGGAILCCNFDVGV